MRGYFDRNGTYSLSLIGSSDYSPPVGIYLEKYNYITGKSEKIFDSLTFEFAKYTSIVGSNNGKKLLLLDYDEYIDNSLDHRVTYQSEKGRAYIYDLKTGEKKFISDVSVYTFLTGRLMKWSDNERYVAFLRDVVVNEINKEIIFQLGIYDALEKKLFDYSITNKYYGEDTYNLNVDLMPVIEITNNGKIFFGYGTIKVWGYVYGNESYILNQDMGYRSIINDLDHQSVMYLSNKGDLSYYNLVTSVKKLVSTTKDIVDDQSYLSILERSEDGNFVIGRGRINNVEGIYLCEFDEGYGLNNIHLVYKFTENMTLVNMRLSSDNKKIALTVNDNQERIKELVIELK